VPVSIKAITVSVNYDDLLRVTLPRMKSHFDSILVVTDNKDRATHRVAEKYGAAVYRTDAFYRHGAVFNKGLAIEEAFDQIGRRGWILLVDADIILPPDVDLSECDDPERLYSPYRRLLKCPSDLTYLDHQSWSTLERGPEGTRNDEFAGYFQLFHADATPLKVKPWYGIGWRTAGGCDSEFWWKWDREKLTRPSFEVLHVGQPNRNWKGRVTPRVQL